MKSSNPAVYMLAVVTAAAIMVVTALVACSINPATGKEDLAPLVGKPQQVALGMQSSPQFEQQGGGKITNAAIVSYIDRIGQKDADAARALFPKEAEGFQFTYTCLNDAQVNAFALPGGPIFITRGILNKMSSEAQLAFVLGHETGHVIAQHVARQMTQNEILQGAVGATDLLIGTKSGTAAQVASAAGQFATQMYSLKYSRTDESQADHLGLLIMVKAGYNPQASIDVMRVLDSLGSQGPEWTSTHPAPKNRLVDLQQQIAQLFPNAVGDPRYIRGEQEYQQNVLSQHTRLENVPDFFNPTKCLAAK